MDSSKIWTLFELAVAGTGDCRQRASDFVAIVWPETELFPVSEPWRGHFDCTVPGKHQSVDIQKLVRAQKHVDEVFETSFRRIRGLEAGGLIDLLQIP